jgi:hypothetical protein
MLGTAGRLIACMVGTEGKVTCGAAGSETLLIVGMSVSSVGWLTLGLSKNEKAGAVDVNVGAAANNTVGTPTCEYDPVSAVGGVGEFGTEGVPVSETVGGVTSGGVALVSIASVVSTSPTIVLICMAASKA